MKLEIKRPPYFQERFSGIANPIVIQNLRFGKTSRGHFIFSFDCPSHKFLEVERNLSREFSEENYMAATLGFSTKTSSIDEKDGIEMPDDWIEISIIPENKEEENELRGIPAVLTRKYGYSVTIIPVSDFDYLK